MEHITLTAEQMQILERASVPVEVRDEEGQVLAHLLPLTDAQIVQRIKQNRAAGEQPRYPAEVVEAHLRKLAEIRAREGMDEAKMFALLERMRAGESL